MEKFFVLFFVKVVNEHKYFWSAVKMTDLLQERSYRWLNGVLSLRVCYQLWQSLSLNIHICLRTHVCKHVIYVWNISTVHQFFYLISESNSTPTASMN